MELNTTKKNPKNSKIFHCEKCDFICFKKSLYEKHLLTKKHNTTNTTKIQQKKFHYCECGKQYTHRASLFNHKKKCEYASHDKTESTEEFKNTNEPIVELLLKENLEMKKDNLEMKKMMIDLCQKIEPISNNTSINSHNKVFNISLFLNEDCKDAMNMSDFIESIQLSIEDLEKIGSEGQTQALSNILTDRLNDLEVVKRPVHCSDPKKEIIYVKDEGKWEKEPKHKPNLKKALDKITMESMYKIPDIIPNEETYAHTLSEIMKEPREDRKIISEVSKKIVVN